MRLIGNIALAMVCAALGVVAGRSVARMRGQGAGRLTMDAGAPGLRELVPGLVAAMRMRDQPWSYLHVPSWLAAFIVNFAFAAFSRELAPFLRAAGIAGDDPAPPAEAQWRPERSEIWTSELPPGRPQQVQDVAPGFRPFAT